MVFKPCAVQITSFSGLFDPVATLGIYPGATIDRSAKQAMSTSQSQCCNPVFCTWSRTIMARNAKGGWPMVTMGPKRAAARIRTPPDSMVETGRHHN